MLAAGDEAVDEVGDLVAAVVELSRRRHQLVALDRGAHDVADLGQSGEHALAGTVSQAALDVVLDVERRIDRAHLLGDLGPVVQDGSSAGGNAKGGLGSGIVLRHGCPSVNRGVRVGVAYV